jgi:hypothetical protein
MLNLLKKTTPWMVASLFVATSVFAQQNSGNKNNGGSCAPACPPKSCKPCPQPTPPTQTCPPDPCCPPWSTPVLNAAYNYPARTQTRCPWDINFDVSFIYWQPIQENMELGFSNSTTDPFSSPVAQGYVGKVVNLDFDFKPGFKIGMGGYFDHDGWDMHFEYTWFHNSQHTKATPTAEGQFYPAFGKPATNAPVTYPEKYNSASETWRLNMDIAELDLGRWYYVGTELTFRPSFGLRAAWIGQKLDVEYTGTVSSTVKEKTSSWAIGAQAGLNTNWMITSGFRLFGNAEADLLFTKYTNLSFKNTYTNTALAGLISKQRQVYAVKPHLDLELGMGWGTYIDCNNWYLDFALGYGFQVFFNQNMFRHFTDDAAVANSNMPNGNLYIQGLTFTAKLDF